MPLLCSKKPITLIWATLPVVLRHVLIESVSVFFVVLVPTIFVRRFDILQIYAVATQAMFQFLLDGVIMQSPLLFLWVWHEVTRTWFELWQSFLNDHLAASVDKRVFKVRLMLRYAVWKPQRLNENQVFHFVQQTIYGRHVLQNDRLVQLQQ